MGRTTKEGLAGLFETRTVIKGPVLTSNQTLIDLGPHAGDLRLSEPHTCDSCLLDLAALGESPSGSRSPGRPLQVSRGGAPILEDGRIVDSNNNVLIQLADRVAGTLRRHAEEEKQDAIEYRTMIHKRIEDVWNVGEGERVQT